VVLELNEVRSLATLAELGSVTLTAEHPHLSTAAIHKQLKAREASWACLYEMYGHRLNWRRPPMFFSRISETCWPITTGLSRRLMSGREWRLRPIRLRSIPGSAIMQQ
jgi:hypothetical protein